MKYLLSISLCAMLVTPTKASEPEIVFQPAAGVAVGVTVVAAFGYGTYRLVKFCQKKFPPKQNGETNSFGFSASGDDEYAAAYEYSSIGSCNLPESLISNSPTEGSNSTTFTLNIKLNQNSSSISMSANSDPSIAQTWDEFAAEMAEHGLVMTGRPSWPQFSRSRVPCSSASVPLSFDEATGRVIHNTGGELKRVTVERSLNLQDWYPFLVTDTGERSGLKVIDTTREGQMFYRVSVSQP